MAPTEKLAYLGIIFSSILGGLLIVFDFPPGKYISPTLAQYVPIKPPYFGGLISSVQKHPVFFLISHADPTIHHMVQNS